jgi:hypothetical protein
MEMVAQSSTSLPDHLMCLCGSVNVNGSNHVGSVQPREPRPVDVEPREHAMLACGAFTVLSRHDCKHLTGQSLPRTAALDGLYSTLQGFSQFPNAKVTS